MPIEIRGGKMYLFDDSMSLVAETDAPIRLHHYGRVDIALDLAAFPEAVRGRVTQCQLTLPVPVLIGNSDPVTVVLVSKVIPLNLGGV